MQIPWLILKNCHFPICRRWKRKKKIMEYSAFTDRLKNSAAKESLNGPKSEAQPLFPSSSHLCISLPAHLSFVFTSAIKKKKDFWAIFKSCCLLQQSQNGMCARLNNMLWLCPSAPFFFWTKCKFHATVFQLQSTVTWRIHQASYLSHCTLPDASWILCGGSENKSEEEKK